MFQGKSLRLAALPDGVFEVCFDRAGQSINKFDDQTVEELRHVIEILRFAPNLRGVLATSAKDVFIVGADITEFGEKFGKPSDQITEDVLRSNEVFIAFEDLSVPTVVAINGYALGGGLEFVLASSLRIIAEGAQVGVPEVKLGLFPGFGGTVRLARVAGAASACEWVAGGKPFDADSALEAGVVDAVVPAAQLREEALAWLSRAMDGQIDWRERQERKRRPVVAPESELRAAFAAAREKATKSAPPHQPAADAAIDMMERAAFVSRNAAVQLEARAFGKLARTQAARSMIQAFVNEQAVKKLARAVGGSGTPVKRAAVLGAGIMGGGIAFASARFGVPVRLKDLQQNALDQSVGEAVKQTARLVKTGRLPEARARQLVESITPQLDTEGFGEVDIVIEAIVENLDVKRRVLAELEPSLGPAAIIASNTSSLRIEDIASALRNPERLVGMHFFNPVPLMPLVEVVRGSKTSDIAVATAVAYARTMGKTAIVVKDCPGFLVNRVLTAYIRGFLQLVADGADFEKVDQAMEAFGWPMGPAYLEDVVGMDTGSHVNDIISAGYPHRMPPLQNDALRLMARWRRFGQKSGFGFYRYEPSSTGKPARGPAGDTRALLLEVQPRGPRDFAADEIVDRMMIPMVLEAARALHEGVVGTAAEVDLAMQLGLGFPAYAGGPLQYADWLGLEEVIARCERLASLGPAYIPDDMLRAKATRGQSFY